MKLRFRKTLCLLIKREVLHKFPHMFRNISCLVTNNVSDFMRSDGKSST